MGKTNPKNNEITDAFSLLEQGVYAALQTYSNIHRGSGHNSIVTTHLFDEARNIILEYLRLNKGKYIVIFCTARRVATLKSQLEPGSYHIVSSQDIGLPLGVMALAVKRRSLPGGIPFETGGGTTRLISRDWVIWANAPDRFEAGTPAIINVVAFARALQLMKRYGENIFHNGVTEKLTVDEILYHDELEEYSGIELLNKLRETLVGNDILVPTMEGDSPYIHLDNAASTPTFTPVWNTVCQTWRQPEQIQQGIIHKVRSICAEFLGAPLADYDIIFTSNTTEAINLVTESFKVESEPDTEQVIVNTILEHSSNDLPWRMVPRSSLIRLPVDREGFMDLYELDMLLSAYNQENQYKKKRIKLVAVSGASNVLGVFNNIAEISRIVHRNGVHLLVDAAQWVAHRKVSMEKNKIDFLAFSSHKVYAPFGCGVLVVRKGLLNFSAAKMELIKKSGEENVAGIAALGKALILLKRIGMDVIQHEEQELTRRALIGLSQIHGLKIFGIKDPHSSSFAQKGGVIAFTMKSKMPNQIARELAMRSGIGVRYGCQCAHILVKYLLNVSPKLERFQRLMLTMIPMVRLPGLARVSLGIENSEADVDKLIFALDEISGQPELSADRDNTTSQNEKPNPTKSEIKKQMKDFIMAAASRVYFQSR